MTEQDMRMGTVRRTPEPEKLVCQMGRGDMYDGFILDTDYHELMDPVEPKDHHIEEVQELADWISPDEKIMELGGSTYKDEGVETLYKQYRLLDKFISRGHWGVFEHPQISLAVEGASRVVMAQVTRHRHMTFDIQSQRYVDFSGKEDPFKTPRTLQEPVDDDSGEIVRGEGLVDLDDDVREEYRERGTELYDEMLALYEEMQEDGVPGEDARFFLPLGSKVNMGFSGNARALLHVMNIRMKANAQWEARDLSGMMKQEFEDWMPMTAKIFEKRGPFDLSP